MTSHDGSLLRWPVDRYFLRKAFGGYVERETNCFPLKIKSRWRRWQLGTQSADQGCEQSGRLVLSSVDPLNSRLDSVDLYSGNDFGEPKTLISNSSNGGDMCIKDLEGRRCSGNSRSIGSEACG